MALDINDEGIDRLAREVAERAGESINEAVHVALQERLQRVSGPQRTTQREKLYEILRRVDALPRKTDLTDDEILGYNA